MTSPRRARRSLALVLVFVLAGVGVATARVVVVGRAALAAGDAAAAAGRAPDAIAAWEAAARSYAPLAPHVDGAYERLRTLARTQHRHALPAWRAIRSAARSTGHLWRPHAAELAEASDAIAELASRDPEGAAAGGPDASTRRAFHVARLAQDTLPGPGPRLLVLAGLAGLAAGIAVLLGSGFDRTGQLLRRPALAGVAIAAGGIGLWTVSVLVGV